MSEEFEAKSDDAAEDVAGGDQTGDEAIVGETPKRATSPGMLIVLGVVVIAGALAFVKFKQNSPASAEASVDSSAKETIDNFLSSPTNGVQSMQSMLQNTEKLVQQFLAYPTATQVPLSALHTNPFRTSPDNIPAGDDSDFLTRKKREDERLAAIKAVQDLQLQSIIHSETRRACMISNMLYQEGQQIGTFTVEKITPKTVVVKSGAFRFELKMQK